MEPEMLSPGVVPFEEQGEQLPGIREANFTEYAARRGKRQAGVLAGTMEV